MGRVDFFVLSRSEALHVAVSQAVRSAKAGPTALHMQVRFERLPQPVEGMVAF